MSGNIFGTNNEEKKKVEFESKVDSHSKAILTVVEKHKALESSLDLLTEKFDLIDHNSIKNFKKLFDEIKNLKGELRDIKHEIKDIKEFNGKVTKQLKLMTTKDEVTKLEKYIDLWNPMDFVTRDELKEAHEKTIEELRSIIETFLTDDK